MKLIPAVTKNSCQMIAVFVVVSAFIDFNTSVCSSVGNFEDILNSGMHQ